MTAARFFSHPQFRAFMAKFALLAVVLQVLALPISCAHMAGTLGKTQLITICTQSGNTQLLVGEDGQPVKQGVAHHFTCPACVLAAASLLLAATLLLSAPRLRPTPLHISSDEIRPALRGFWPLGQAPPAAVLR